MVHDDETVDQDFAAPHALVLGDEVERAATHHYLSSAPSSSIGQQGAELSAKWAAESALASNDLSA